MPNIADLPALARQLVAPELAPHGRPKKPDGSDN